MRKIRKKTLGITALVFSYLLFFLPASAQATAAEGMVTASQQIKGLQPVLTTIRQKAKVPVLFPRVIPQDRPGVVYYASTEQLPVTAGGGYVVNVDFTATCQGAHYCNVGSMRAEYQGKPELMRDRQNKVITQLVKLPGNQIAYFTPGHAMGSYFSPSLQWRQGPALYTLTWDDHFANKEAFLAMANSARN